MPKPLRRKRLQIHLSAAIVLMFAAGGLIWANVSERTVIMPDDRKAIYYGWPFPGWRKAEPEIEDLSGRPDSLINKHTSPGMGIPLDVIVAIFTLFAVWFLCEWLIRRRATRNGT